jgi:hypothetical protein
VNRATPAVLVRALTLPRPRPGFAPAARPDPTPGPSGGSRRAAVRRRTVAYGIPALAACGMVATWFSPGAFFATGDIGPFEHQEWREGALSFWSHQTTGFGSADSHVLGLFDYVLDRACHALGLGVPVAEYLSYASAVLCAAVGVAFLAAVWLRRPWAVAFAGVAAISNAYIMVDALYPQVYLTIGAVGLGGGCLLRRARGQRVSVLLIAAASPVVLSRIAVNPPMLAVTAAALGVLTVFAGRLTRGSTRAAVATALTALPLVALVNLWWMVPLGLSVAGAGGGSALTAQTDVVQWAWVQERQSIANVLTLNAHIGWPDPRDYPFAGDVASPWWSVLRWALPVLALSALVPLRRRPDRLPRLAFAGVVLVLVFLAKGLHGPFGSANLALYRQLPGMWLFREPMAKFGALLALCFAILSAAALERMAGWRPSGRTAKAWAATAALAACGCAVLAYPRPLWDGTLATAHGPLPSATVRVPAAWYQVADTVNRSSLPGKAVELPLPGFYMDTTTWGFHGTDLIPQELITRPLLKQMPGGYVEARQEPLAALSQLQADLVSGDRDGASNLMHALAISQVILRLDLVPDGNAVRGAASVTDPAPIERTLAGMPNAVRTISTDVADVYTLPAAPMVSAYTKATAVTDGSAWDAQGTDSALFMSALPTDTLAAGPVEIVAPLRSVAVPPSRQAFGAHCPAAAAGFAPPGPAPTVDRTGVIHLHASDGQVACAIIAVAPASALGRIEVTTRASGDANAVAWYCALPEGSTSCSLDTPIGINDQPTAESARMLAASPGALRIAVLLRSPQSGSASIRVSSPAVVSYPFDPVRITPVSAAPPAPAVSYRTSSPGSYAVSTGPAHSGTWIVLADSYAPRWTLSGLPAGWRAQHLRVDGYANGWLLTGSGTPRLNLRLDYGPDRYVRLAEEISLAIAGAICAGLLIPVARRAAARRRSRKEAGVRSIRVHQD